MINLTNSLALQQAKIELQRYNYYQSLKLKETLQIAQTGYYFLEIFDSERFKHILIAVFAIFLIKIVMFDPLKLSICYSIILYKKRKYRKIFLEENANLRNSEDMEEFCAHDTNEYQDANKKSASSLISYTEEKNGLGDDSTRLSLPNDVNSLVFSIISLQNSETNETRFESVLGSGVSSISNDEHFAKELHKLADLYANFCAHLEYNYANIYIPSTRHFLEWLYIKQNTEKSFEEIKNNHSVILN